MELVIFFLLVIARMINDMWAVWLDHASNYHKERRDIEHHYRRVLLWITHVLFVIWVFL